MSYDNMPFKNKQAAKSDRAMSAGPGDPPKKSASDSTDVKVYSQNEAISKGQSFYYDRKTGQPIGLTGGPLKASEKRSKELQIGIHKSQGGN